MKHRGKSIILARRKRKNSHGYIVVLTDLIRSLRGAMPHQCHPPERSVPARNKMRRSANLGSKCGVHEDRAHLRQTHRIGLIRIMTLATLLEFAVFRELYQDTIKEGGGQTPCQRPCRRAPRMETHLRDPSLPHLHHRPRRHLHWRFLILVEPLSRSFHPAG